MWAKPTALSSLVKPFLWKTAYNNVNLRQRSHAAQSCLIYAALKLPAGNPPATRAGRGYTPLTGGRFLRNGGKQLRSDSTTKKSGRKHKNFLPLFFILPVQSVPHPAPRTTGAPVKPKAVRRFFLQSLSQRRGSLRHLRSS